MWILPKNYPLYSRYAQDTLVRKEDLSLPGLNIEQSLLSKSKPTRLRTWQTRWKQGSFYPHLFGRILKPCQWNRFETELTSSLAVIHVNLSQPPESEKERKTPDISGLTSEKSSEQLDLFGASLKTSKDTSPSDSEKSLATWKALVIKQRGEYSQRVKLAHLTRENESTSWPTVTTDSASTRTKKYAQGGMPLSMAVNTWPTPAARDHKGASGYGRQERKGFPRDTLPNALVNWPTATVFDVTGGSYPTELVNGQWRSKHSKDPNSPWYGAKLRDAVETAEKMNWPTPTVAEAEKISNRPNFGQLGLSNHPEVHGQKLSREKLNKSKGGLPDRVRPNTDGKALGQLNADWVEHLMGVPTGWTDLGSWEMALCHRQPPKHG